MIVFKYLNEAERVFITARPQFCYVSKSDNLLTARRSLFIVYQMERRFSRWIARGKKAIAVGYADCLGDTTLKTILEIAFVGS